MKILFMGTPEFARGQLSALWENRETYGWEIVGAVSQPDKPKGRGYKMIPTPVKTYAQSVGIAVYQPESVKDEAFLALLAELDPALIVVAAYGKMLPEAVLAYPKYGCINVHGSLLPAYRGAAPIQRAMMDGVRVTGNTIQYMAKGMDTGDIISCDRVEIGENEDFGSLYDRMGKSGAKLLLKTIPAIENGTACRTAQDDACATIAPKIEKAECALDFSLPAEALHNRIRALSPAPLAYTTLYHEGTPMRIKIAASVTGDTADTDASAVCGTVLSLDAKKNEIRVQCGNGSILCMTAVVPEGKGRMHAGDFIRGRKIALGDRFGD